VIAFGGTDEIGKLSSSFEVMRLKLADSLDELQTYNAALEQKVTERTEQININRKQIKDLLKKVITSQEEERKRIAREFHDGILQDLAAALIRVDVLRAYPESITPEKIEDIRSIIDKNIQEVYTIIKNLRPAILDDLGFEAAVRWLIDTHLESKGITCYATIRNIDDIEFEPLAEIELFRIIQEAITNIAKHANAEHVFLLLELKGDILHIEIEDDGSGFEVQSVSVETDSGRGLGLLGMEERAGFLNWSLQVCSSPGHGTRVSVKVPVTKGAIQHV
jgi:signal transduction histidine kinase